MSQTNANSTLPKIDQQELQHLITVSTGFIDAYIIQCYAQIPMLLPQNIVLSALDSSINVDHIDWHDFKLPVYKVNSPTAKTAVALVIEGEQVDQRFALICDEMPQTIRLRISEVVDEEQPFDDSNIYQYVRMGDQIFQVPNLNEIQNQLSHKTF
ncbi:hypothetical protein [Acinetobacter radioresistens]|uniref:hypothetical protein n=1 Tax=Acinetobacter radioresistens TaxID=40216 RepID=UPI00224668E7|nr:hypothetical protein [Acinetobacter radioresistens]MCX0333295.1 hypothetical protein [Acinetobacter radioresistens]